MGNPTRLTTLFPWWLVIILLLAVAFAALGIWLYRRSFYQEAGVAFKEKWQEFLTQHQLFFSRFGLFRTNPMGQSFLYALKMLRVFVGGHQFQYTLPWVVMMGGNDTGKASILRSLGLDRPINHPEGEIGAARPPCDWWFFDHGIVLDVDGRLVLNAQHPTSDDSSWSFFLSLLTHYRPRRPLDAVILTISASELIGASAFSHDDLILRAEHLYEKLWHMQRVTGLKLPIYIVISKCDLVPGFEDFCKTLPLPNGSDMFGWSSDKGMESVYAPEWIGEAFSSMEASLSLTQQEIFTEGCPLDKVDGVFVLPIAFRTLKEGIQTYTDHLFKSSGLHESFFLRGLYFVGDSHRDQKTPSPASLDTSRALSSQEGQEKRNIYFAKDLFENKIFREAGLARPIERILLSERTTNRSAKIAIATATILGTLGLLKANQNLRQTTLNLMSVLPQMDRTLEKLRTHNAGTSEGKAYFANQAQVLLETMAKANVSVLFSPFLVPSWFNTLDTRIRDVMIIVYDKVILRSMADQLTHKAEELITLTNHPALPDTLANNLNPLRTQEFYQLNNYVEHLHRLQIAANKFNSLGVNSTLGDIADIIFYLFKYKMPDAFFVDNYYYVAALKQTTISRFNFDTYKENATLELTKLFKSFQTAAFNPNTMIPGLAQLMVNLQDFSTTHQTSSNFNGVRDIYTSLDQTITSLNNPELRWLNQDQFFPGTQYETLMQMIGASDFFKPQDVANLPTSMNQSFLNFRKRLAGYTFPILGGHTLFTQRDGLALAAPSPEAVALRNSLRAFFNESFMAPAAAKDLVTTVPKGTAVLWDSLRLQEATQLIQSYNDFINARLLKVPKMLQPLFQKMAREGLSDSLMELLANAQVFHSDTGEKNLFSPEDALLPQVQNYRVAAPFLERILTTLWTNNANTAYVSLRNLLFIQAYAPLEKLETILRDDNPYGLKMGSFGWWQGDKMAALEAFNVSNPTELQHYLNLQRDRIHYLAREFAAPLIALLENIAREGMPENAPLVTKWQEIIDAFNSYEKNGAGNGLKELEAFILTPLNEVTLATCAQLKELPAIEYNFFTETLATIQEKLRKQCTDLSGTVSVDQYMQIASFFNANLANKFPFVKDPNAVSPDASPESLRTFFEMMDSQAKGIKETLQQAEHLGPAGKNALMFIEQMDTIRAFFGDYLAPAATVPHPAFAFEVTFRVNREREVYANEVLTWQVETKNTTFSMRSPDRKGYWQAGDPFKVSFIWASNSALQPMGTGGKGSLSVQGEAATYTYDGTWALLKLLRQHQAGPSDFKDLKDEKPITLHFDVPLSNASTSGTPPCAAAGGGNSKPNKATLFISVAVSPAKVEKPKKEDDKDKPKDEKEGAPKKIQMGAPLALPFFPHLAPPLGKDANKALNVNLNIPAEEEEIDDIDEKPEKPHKDKKSTTKPLRSKGSKVKKHTGHKKT